MPLAQILVIVNLIVQILLFSIVLAAVYLARIKRRLVRHCTIMRVAVIIQIISIAVVMLPSMLGYFDSKPPGLLFSLEIPIHHSLGLLVIALWIYVNLVFKGIIKVRARLVWPMRLAFSAWLVTLLLGFHIYYFLWVGG